MGAVSGTVAGLVASVAAVEAVAAVGDELSVAAGAVDEVVDAPTATS